MMITPVQTNRAAAPVVTGDPTGINSVIYAGGQFVAGGFTGTDDYANACILTSTNGSSWTIRTDAFGGAGASVLGLAFGASTYVAVGLQANGNGGIMSSSDGITWTSRTTSFDAPGKVAWGVAFGAGLFVAVGDSGSGAIIESSPDGITWTTRTVPSFTGITTPLFLQVAFGNSLFVAVGYGAKSGDVAGVLATSSNGTSWTARSAPTIADGTVGYLADAATCSSSLCVIGGYKNSDGTPVLASSSDGTTWTARTSDITPQGMGFGGTTYFNGGSTAGTTFGLATSPDAITWTDRTIPSGDAGAINGVAYDGSGVYVAAGGGNRALGFGAPPGEIFRSTNTTTWTQVL